MSNRNFAVDLKNKQELSRCTSKPEFDYGLKKIASAKISTEKTYNILYKKGNKIQQYKEEPKNCCSFKPTFIAKQKNKIIESKRNYDYYKSYNNMAPYKDINKKKRTIS